MSTPALVCDSSVHDRMVEAGLRHVIPYYDYLAARADADGNLWDSRAHAAAHFRVTPRTITYWRKALEGLGVVLRWAGGFRGECVSMHVVRWLSDTAARIGKRARAAVWLARKRRIAARATEARLRGGKGEMKLSPLISLQDEEAANPRLGPHPFIDTDIPAWCSCGLPKANAVHRT
jgi:hypothetical protein